MAVKLMSSFCKTSVDLYVRGGRRCFGYWAVRNVCPCDGVTRRDLLQGRRSLGLLGLTLPRLEHLSQARSATIEPAAGLPGFGQAKACILLFMYGSPSQLETFDPKPDAPLEIRGELGCIPSSVAGLNVCDRLPRLAQVMDKATVIRSVSHPYPMHGVAVRDNRDSADRDPDGAPNSA